MSNFNRNALNQTCLKVHDEIMASLSGGQINAHASKVVDENTVILHYWDGRRFQLSVKELPNGCAYDAATGLTITVI